MAAETVDHVLLAQKVREQYRAIEAGSITELPRGEDARLWLVDGVHCVRVEAADTPDPWVASRLHEAAGLRVSLGLYEQGQIGAVVAPYRARSGSVSFRLGPYRVSAFPWIEGRSLYRTPRPDGSAAAAALLARIHATRIAIAALPRVHFTHPYAAIIRRAVRDTRGRQTRRAGELRRLLAMEEGSLHVALLQTRRLAGMTADLPLRWGITHGDARLDNFIADRSGQLHLVDWGEAALGPVERDLWHLAGPGFRAAMRAYATAAGRIGGVPHPTALAYYEHRWWLREIARYCSRILWLNVSEEDDERDWARLSPYLPLRLGELQGRCRAMAEALATA